MWCRHVRSQLSAYSDGELSASAARAVEEHLAHCERCAQERAGLQRLARFTALVPFEEMPAGLHARILGRLAYADAAPAMAAPVPSFRLPRPVWPASWVGAALTGAAAALAVGFIATRPPKSSSVALPSLTPHETRSAREAPVAPTTAEASDEAQPRVTVRDRAPRRAVHVAERSGRVERPGVTLAAGAEVGPREARSIVRGVRVNRGPASGRALRPQPELVVPVGTQPGVEPATPEPMPPMALMEPAKPVMMPGDPVINQTGPVTPGDAGGSGMEKDPNNSRMAGMMAESDSEGEDEDGLRSLQMFFDERNRTVPQPPMPGMSDERRSRKSL